MGKQKSTIEIDLPDLPTTAWKQCTSCKLSYAVSGDDDYPKHGKCVRCGGDVCPVDDENMLAGTLCVESPKHLRVGDTYASKMEEIHDIVGVATKGE